MTQEIQKNSYLLMDSRDGPLARALLLSQPEDSNWQIEVLEDKIDLVMEHEEIQMVPMAENGPILLGRIIRSRNDKLFVEKLKCLDSERRQNLRMPTSFKSFIYPVSGSWRGRREIEAKDLSCGGIAFYCMYHLAIEEVMEIVIPITEEPVILRCHILRQRESDREDATLYAAKFIDMCPDEEMIVREAVFNIQLQGRPRAG